MGRVVLEDLLNLLSGPDLIRIRQKDDSELCFEGYWGTLRDYKHWLITPYKLRTVHDYHVTLEVRRKDWREKGLAAPMMPEEQAQFNFSDMQVNIIHDIWI